MASTALLALAALGLVGCGTPAPEPQPLTTEQVEAIRSAHAEEWWNSVQPDVPMPDVDVIGVYPPGEAFELRRQCLETANLPGVTVTDDGGWSIQGEPGDPAFTAADAQVWVCAQQYRAEGETDHLLSPSQLEWLYDFYVLRYRPCVATMGHELLNFPSREVFLGSSVGYATWIPHDFSVEPVPTPEGWALIAQRCPLPEMLESYGLPGYAVEESSSP